MMISPKQMAMNLLKSRCGNNPMLNNVMQMANSGNMQGVEQVARNLCKEKGINADQKFNEIRSRFK